ncbi:MAG TPA: hypothetical protein VGI42_00545 [Chthoniobacterales bacterium]
MPMLRLLVVALSVLSWFAASNHCVLAAQPLKMRVMEQGDMPSGCPMRSMQQPSQPVKQGGCGDLPCCKNLQATKTAVVKMVAAPIWLGALVTFFTPFTGETSGNAAKILSFLDTGPPGETSFAELVLQRSILAHAPPGSLS